ADPDLQLGVDAAEGVPAERGGRHRGADGGAPPAQLGRDRAAQPLPEAELLTMSAPKPKAHRASSAETAPKKIDVQELSAGFGDKTVLRSISMAIEDKRVTAIIGPLGCGKSTFSRCLNRMHELSPIARLSGRIMLDGRDIYDKGVDPVLLRLRVGMVFQKPNPFPTMSIRDNVLAGLKLTASLRRSTADQVAEKALKQAALWDEVKDRLGDTGGSLSGGQQQRLCIARALAVDP